MRVIKLYMYYMMTKFQKAIKSHWTFSTVSFMA